MQFSNAYNKKPYRYMYMQGGQTREKAAAHPYLGVQFSQNLKCNEHVHIAITCCKASRILGFVTRNLYKCPKSVKAKAYTTLVRPGMEYSAAIWSPHQATQKHKLESIQRKAARFVMHKPCNYKKPDSVTEMLGHFGWPSPEERRDTAWVTLMYKIVHNLVHIPDIYHPISMTRSTRVHHGMKFRQYQCNTESYRHSFFPATIPLWNTLPGQAVEAPSLDAFKEVMGAHTN